MQHIYNTIIWLPENISWMVNKKVKGAIIHQLIHLWKCKSLEEYNKTNLYIHGKGCGGSNDKLREVSATFHATFHLRSSIDDNIAQQIALVWKFDAVPQQKSKVVCRTHYPKTNMSQAACVYTKRRGRLSIVQCHNNSLNRGGKTLFPKSYNPGTDKNKNFKMTFISS